MKKHSKTALSVCLCLILLIAFCGCVDKGEKEARDREETLEENALMCTRFGQNGVYHDGVLYFVFPTVQTLYYSVLDDGENGPLCSKAECTHDSDDCSARLHSITDPHLMLYNGRLFFTDQDHDGWTLVSVTPGSADRRSHAAFAFEAFAGMYGSFSATYNDTLYFCGSREGVAGGEPFKQIEIYSQSLSGGNMELLYDTQALANTHFVVKEHGRTICFAQSGKDSLILNAFDMADRSVETLYDGTAPDIYNEMIIDDDRIVFQGFNSIAELDLTNGEWKELYRTEQDISVFSGKYVLIFTGMTSYRCDGLDGRTIAEGTVSAEGFDSMMYEKTPIGCIDEKMFIFAHAMDGHSESFLLSYDPETDLFEVVCTTKRSNGRPKDETMIF